MKLKLLVLPLLLGLAACATPQQQQTKVWVRTDGRAIASNPALAKQATIDATICLGQTQQAAVGMPVLYYQGIGGAISASIIQSQRDQQLVQVAEGCMAQRGYLHVPAKPAPAAAG